MKKILSIILTLSILFAIACVGVPIASAETTDLQNPKFKDGLQEKIDTIDDNTTVKVSIWFRDDEANNQKNLEEIFPENMPEVLYCSKYVPNVEMRLTKSQIYDVATFDKVMYVCYLHDYNEENASKEPYLDESQEYSVVNTLTHVNSSNKDNVAIGKYHTVLIPQKGYKIIAVKVVMGNKTLDAAVRNSDGSYYINTDVTDNINITAIATRGDAAEKLTDYEVFYNYVVNNCSYPSASAYANVIVDFGKVGGYSLFYGLTGEADAIKKITLGDYLFYVLAEQCPDDLGLYLVKNGKVFTLQEIYNKYKINMDQVVSAIRAYDNPKIFPWRIYKNNVQIKLGVVPKLSATTAVLKSGQSRNLKVTNGTVKSWSSSSKKVVSVNKGKITALNKGTSIITATLTTGKVLKCKVKVTTAPRLSKGIVVVKKGKTVTVKLTGKSPSINNRYTNTGIAKINSGANATTLKIKGVRKGTTTLKVRVNGVKILNVRVKVN